MQLQYRGQSYVPSRTPQSTAHKTPLQFLGRSYTRDGSQQSTPTVEPKPILQFLGRSYAMS